MMTLTIRGRHSQPVEDFASASAAYAYCREISGEGNSTFPCGVIERDGRAVARVSYNGRVWANREWQVGDTPLFDPQP